MRYRAIITRIIAGAEGLGCRLHSLLGGVSARASGMAVPGAYRRFTHVRSMEQLLLRLSPKKVAAIALVINLMFLGIYFFTGPLSAAESRQTSGADVKKQTVVDSRVQLESLKQREELLRIRQRELLDLERRIDEKIRRLTTLETNVKSEVAAYKQISDTRVKHLVKIYSSMKPNAAAKLMDQTDIEVATEVFLSMKGEVAGGILAYMEPQKAANITRRLMSSRTRQSAAAPVSGPAPDTAPAQVSNADVAAAYAGMEETGREGMLPATGSAGLTAPVEKRKPIGIPGTRVRKSIEHRAVRKIAGNNDRLPDSAARQASPGIGKAATGEVTPSAQDVRNGDTVAGTAPTARQEESQSREAQEKGRALNAAQRDLLTMAPAGVQPLVRKGEGQGVGTPDDRKQEDAPK